MHHRNEVSHVESTGVVGPIQNPAEDASPKNEKDATKKRNSVLSRFLSAVERIGNALPHPATLFAILAFGLILLSWLTCKVGLAAIKGAEVLKASGLGPIPLMLCFVLLAAVINLCVGSASAQWAFMAPAFIPMFMLLGYSPELVQGVFRIGDSSTNLISPMMSFFALIAAFVQRYDSKAGIGTVIATMLPYSIAFLVVWMPLLVVWLLLGLPLGPGAELYLQP